MTKQEQSERFVHFIVQLKQSCIHLAGHMCETPVFCISNPCLNSGTCVDDEDGFHCECSSGFTGMYQTAVMR